MLTDPFREGTDLQWVDPYQDQPSKGKWKPLMWQEKYVNVVDVALSPIRWGLDMGMRYLMRPDQQFIAIDYTYITQRRPMNFGNGELIVNLNDSINLHLRPIEIKNKFGMDDFGRGEYMTTEQGYWVISQQDLKKICDADTIAVRVCGRQDFFELDKMALLKFEFMCRSFYQDVFNDTTHSEWINTIVPEGEEGRDNPGCFILFLAYGTPALPPVGIAAGLYLLLKKRSGLDGKQTWAFSRAGRVHGVIIIILSLILLASYFINSKT